MNQNFSDRLLEKPSASASWSSRIGGSASEILQAFQNAAVWSALANRDIKTRYRRTVLGPIWIVILVVASAGMIAFVYGILLGQPFMRYFVFIITSLVSWTLISSVLSEAASLLWLAGSFMKTFHISPTSLILANLYKNVLVWCHAIVPALAGASLVGFGDPGALAMLPIGLGLVTINLGWMAFLIALVGARFRDLHDLVLTFMALAFLITPVIWDPAMLGDYRMVVDLNPLAHLLDLVRRPAMGEWPSRVSVIICGLSAALGWIFAVIVFAKIRHRLALWL